MMNRNRSREKVGDKRSELAEKIAKVFSFHDFLALRLTLMRPTRGDLSSCK